MNKNLKSNTGITVISLVITIIVMLILAGITITMLTGDNGMLQMSRKAGDESQVGEDIERIKASYSTLTMRKLKLADGRRTYKITAEELQEQIISDLNSSTETTVEVTGGELVISKNVQSSTSTSTEPAETTPTTESSPSAETSGGELTVKMTHKLKNGNESVNTFTVSAEGDVTQVTG